MPALPELIRDPIFQLNVLLWLAQPLPSGDAITPLLHSRGFDVYALALRLSLPPDLLLVMRNGGFEVQVGVRPDVILAKESSGKFAITECKGSSFGSRSSTAHQARTLLALAGPRCHEVLGLQPQAVRESTLTYLLPSSQRPAMRATISELLAAFRMHGLAVGEALLLGLAIADEALGLEVDDAAAQFFELPPGTNEFLRLDPDTDPRPLYFVPFDPDTHQSEEEKTLGKRILFERMQSSIIAAVGRAVPPTVVPFKTSDLLNDATFGMYDLWENRDSAKYMRGLCRWFIDSLRKAVHAVEPEAISYERGEGWKLDLPDRGRHERVLNAMLRFSCETMELRQEPEPGLFDDL